MEPKLTPKLSYEDSNKEQAHKEIEKEIKEEKIAEEEIESKIRELRKKRNKERLIREKNVTRKRQKINEDKYISIRDKWGPPSYTAPQKTQREDLNQEKPRKKIRKETEREKLTNLKRVPDRVFIG